MGKLKVLSGRGACGIPARHGLVEVRRQGSHIVMQRIRGSESITVPVPDHQELAIGTSSAIIRQSGVPRREFESH